MTQIIRLLFRPFIPFPPSTKSSLRNLVAVSRVIALRIERMKKVSGSFISLPVHIFFEGAWLDNYRTCFRDEIYSDAQFLHRAFGLESILDTRKVIWKINLSVAERRSTKRRQLWWQNSKIWRQRTVSSRPSLGWTFLSCWKKVQADKFRSWKAKWWKGLRLGGFSNSQQ